MSDIEPGAAAPYNSGYGASEEMRYDLAGNPLPSTPRRPSTDPAPAPPPGSLPSNAETYGAPNTGYPPPAPPYGQHNQIGGYPQPPVPPVAYGQPGPPPAGTGSYGPAAYPAQPYPAYGQPAARPSVSAAGSAQPLNNIAWYLAVAGAVVFVILLLVLAHGSRPVELTAPASYATVTSGDNAFTCEGPSDWTTVPAGEEGSQQGGVLFTRGSARIDITTDQTLSARADVVRSFNTVAGIQTPPVEALHDMTKHGFAGKFGSYREMDAQPIQIPYGDARISEYHATGGPSGDVHGFRVTIYNVNKAIVVDCESPAASWDVLQPVFLKVIQSITPGSG